MDPSNALDPSHAMYRSNEKGTSNPYSTPETRPRPWYFSKRDWLRTTPKSTCPITMSDLSEVPMDDPHKELAVRHYCRLFHIINEPIQPLLDGYTHREAAREQLARMTLVIRDYMILHRIAVVRGKSPVMTEESMIADVVDAALFLPTSKNSAFESAQYWEGEEDTASLKQMIKHAASEHGAEHCGKEAKDLPDKDSCLKTIAGNLHPNQKWRRSRSEDNLSICRKDFVIKDRKKWEKQLRYRKRKRLGLSWPPLAEDS